MSDKLSESQATRPDADRVNENLHNWQRAAETRFKWIGLAAIGLTISLRAVPFISIFSKGIPS